MININEIFHRELSKQARPSDSLSIDNFHCEPGTCTGEIELADWDELFCTQGPYRLFFEMDDLNNTMSSFNEAQKVGYDVVIMFQKEIAEAILTALLAEYPAMQEEYGFSDEEKEEFMPNIVDIAGLSELLVPSDVIIHPAMQDGIPYVGYIFGCTWDDEHAFGAMMHGDRVVEIDGADTAILTWIATKDLEKEVNR